MKSNLIAIDPGKSGGIAYYDGEQVELQSFKNMTQGDIIDTLRSLYIELTVPNVILEQVGGYVGGKGAPGSAMFNFGVSYGLILGSVQAMGMPLELVTPQKWQKKYSISAKGNERKKLLKQKAQQLYPHLKITLDTCDALLLLHYALER